MVQLQLGFSDSTQKAGSDEISAFQLISDSQISPQKYRSRHLDPFYIQTKYRPIGGRLKNYSDQSEAVLRFPTLLFSEFKRMRKFFYLI